MRIVSFSLEQGDKYYGEIEGDRFFIGRRVAYDNGKGLMNVSGTPSQKYNRDDYRADFGIWADLIHPTAIAEGALFHTLNTYDRARFTFSFLQFAAHIPNGDFVLYFRELLKLPLAAQYFPDLRLQDGKIWRMSDDAILALESDISTDGLLNFLNPSSNQVEDIEIIQAAKFIHWSQNDLQHRLLQVKLGISNFKRNMERYAAQYSLGGVLDTVCAVIADIRHQGRAKSPAIFDALQAADPLKSLLQIGEPMYHERLVVLRREINSLVSEGRFGAHVYNLGKKDFVKM